MGTELQSRLEQILGDKRLIVGAIVVAIAAVGGSTWYALRMTPNVAENPSSQESAPPPTIEAVTALGRIEPLGEVINVAPPSNTGGAKVARLLVKQGDRVEPEQVIAVLDNYNRLMAGAERARQEITVAEANLAIVQAGAKQGEIEVARTTVERLTAQLALEQESQRAILQRLEAEGNNANTEYQRYAQLYEDGAVSASERDRLRLNLETANKRLEEAKANAQNLLTTLNKQIQEARANLARIQEIRPVEIRQAQAQVEQAKAAFLQAQADLDLAVVRSPIPGQILKINTHPGETVKETGGIVQIGQTNQMMVVAEVYESDISKVQPNQRAIITSQSGSFEGELQGIVSNIGLQIGKRDVLDTDPAADVDVRVVEVNIMLPPAASQQVAGLTNAKVLVRILL
ncbi:ABC exporter membrane fusion protein [Spirulina subsalsa FACHB-351]|uniref:ABC exporter membrane fusion protein n=1 Tax=Spirulina subsalsa FACHB-351 TaxID=234711 RepID=A0ABT3L725_9CYAN|nr:ABC exporter membrane fusion protein [Spirulina subsalsa]MCW6036760.1 ABC exporter membrane fusion protein [Spirulina subsalsa FACHB-351]